MYICYVFLHHTNALNTAEGHRVLYDREVPFEIRNQTDPHDSAQEVCAIAVVQSKSSGIVTASVLGLVVL
jgi:hypothetical protein